MFERYTENARRAIFFARFEASQLSASQIDAGHILLGIFRADPHLMQGLFHSPSTIVAFISKEIAEKTGTGEKLPNSVDMPLSSGAKRVLSCAMEESRNLQHSHIGTEHLLLGILKESQLLASQILAKQDITTEKVLSYINEKEPLPEGSQADNQKEFTQGIPGGTISAIAGGIPENSASLKAFAAMFAGQGDSPQVKEPFNRLLDLLVQKGLITENEKKDLFRGKDTS